MKILVTEKQLKNLVLNENDITDKFISGYKNLKNILSGNVDMYINVIPGIAHRYYGEENVKSDAFRHILAAAFFTTTIGESLTWLGGETNEFLGAFKNLLKGQGFDSSWEMDSKNNQIGINLGKKHPTDNIDELAKLVDQVIKSGRFYTKKGIFFNDDPNPEF